MKIAGFKGLGALWAYGI